MRTQAGIEMAEVTYFVALPFIVSKVGLAPVTPIECFSPEAAVRAPKCCRAVKAMLGRLHSAGLAIPPPEILATRGSSGHSVMCRMTDQSVGGQDG